VGRVPRPLVLVGPKVVDPRTGFPDGPTKLAYIERAVDLPATLPPGPATADGYPVVSAAEAARSFMSGPGKGPASGVRLVVTAIQLGTAEFDTDRGRQNLAAWQFSFQDVTDPALVLAVAPDRSFQPSAVATRGTMVTDARVGRSHPHGGLRRCGCGQWALHRRLLGYRGDLPDGRGRLGPRAPP